MSKFQFIKLHTFNNNNITKKQPININPLHTKNQKKHKQLLINKTPNLLKLNTATLTLIIKKSIRKT